MTCWLFVISNTCVYLIKLNWKKNLWCHEKSLQMKIMKDVLKKWCKKNHECRKFPNAWLIWPSSEKMNISNKEKLIRTVRCSIHMLIYISYILTLFYFLLGGWNLFVQIWQDTHLGNLPFIKSYNSRLLHSSKFQVRYVHYYYLKYYTFFIADHIIFSTNEIISWSQNTNQYCFLINNFDMLPRKER